VTFSDGWQGIFRAVMASIWRERWPVRPGRSRSFAVGGGFDGLQGLHGFGPCPEHGPVGGA
jgi:hypothetical protein